QPGRSAVRLPLSYPMSIGPSAMRCRSAGMAGGACRALGRLSPGWRRRWGRRVRYRGRLMLSATRRRLIYRRLIQVVPVLFLVTFLSFMLLQLTPGDPALVLAGEHPTEAQIAQIREYYGFDRPMLVQYADWLGNAIQGDLSRSFLSNIPVVDTIAERFPYTLFLVLYALAIAVVIGAPLGIAAAARPGTWVDKLATTLASLAIAV